MNSKSYIYLKFKLLNLKQKSSESDKKISENSCKREYGGLLGAAHSDRDRRPTRVLQACDDQA